MIFTLCFLLGMIEERYLGAIIYVFCVVWGVGS